MSFWLMKSEPDVFGIEHLRAKTSQTEHWDGVRNYQARNFIRDQMQIGDLAFFYHSSCKIPGIVGTVEIVSSAYPDYTSWDKNSEYYDPKSSKQNPRWYMVDVKLHSQFRNIIPLNLLKKKKELVSFPLLKKGNRLSIMPVSEYEWHYIQTLN